MRALLTLVAVGLLALAYVLYVEMPQVFDRGAVASSGSRPAPNAALSNTGTGGSVITPDQAVAATSVLWQLHDRSLVQRNAAALGVIEVDPVRGYDQSLITYALAKSERLAGEPMTSTRVIVPRQTSYPAYFLAVLGLGSVSDPTSAEGSGAVIAVTRSGLDNPWRLAFVTDWTGSANQFVPELDAQGYASEAPSAPATALNPASVPGLVAQYWQTWRTTGKAPADPQLAAIAPGPWTSDVGLKLHPSTTTAGRTTVTSYRVDPSSPMYVASIDSGSHLVCFAIRVDQIDSFGAAGTFQDPWRSSWGPMLPAGLYSGVSTRGVEQSCAMVRTGQVQDSVVLLGRSGGPVQRTGIRSGPEALTRYIDIFALFVAAIVLVPLIWWYVARAT